MAKPSVLVTRRLPDAVHERLRRDYDARLNQDDHLMGPDELLQRAADVDAILPCHTERFDAALIQALPRRVRIIANFSVGVDHVDLQAAAAAGVVVTNTPDVLSDATAEIALLLALGAARRASEGERLVRSGNWRDWSPAFMVGRQLTGRRVGLVGMGRVGQVAARRYAGFDMPVHYHNRKRLPEAVEQALGATYHPDLESLLAVAEVLSLHCPATPETRGLLDARRLACLPQGAIVVNTARGALVDDDALLAALASGQVSAAGLDVFNDEPGGDPRYRECDNVFLLPHIGSATRETRDAMGFRALDNLDAWFAGRPPGDRVA